MGTVHRGEGSLNSQSQRHKEITKAVAPSGVLPGSSTSPSSPRQTAFPTAVLAAAGFRMEMQPAGITSLAWSYCHPWAWLRNSAINRALSLAHTARNEYRHSSSSKVSAALSPLISYFLTKHSLPLVQTGSLLSTFGAGVLLPSFGHRQRCAGGAVTFPQGQRSLNRARPAGCCSGNTAGTVGAAGGCQRGEQ